MANYRTADNYEYWQSNGVNWIHVQGPTILSFIYETTSQWYWTLLKIERDMNHENKFRAIIGQSNDYTIITLPELSSDSWTLLSATWSLLGVQWFQQEVATAGDLPSLSVNEDGYVYRVKDTGDYWIWNGGHWVNKAPNGTYTKYSDLPVLTAYEDGYVATVTQEPQNYKGSVANFSMLPPANMPEMNGWVYKTLDTGDYYVADWDFVENSGAWRKINVNYCYQWQWNPITQSGNWEQSNMLKIYLNGGQDGTYAKTYRSVANPPTSLIINKNLFGKIDELRIDTINRDPKEIMTWYKSNAPYFPRGMKTIVI